MASLEQVNARAYWLALKAVSPEAAAQVVSLRLRTFAYGRRVGAGATLRDGSRVAGVGYEAGGLDAALADLALNILGRSPAQTAGGADA